MAIKDKGAFTAAIFNRLAVGGRRGERYSVKADREPDATTPADDGHMTARQIMQVKQVLFFHREAQRRTSSAIAAAARREGNDDGTAHHWNPPRPHRRRSR